MSVLSPGDILAQQLLAPLADSMLSELAELRRLTGKQDWTLFFTIPDD